MWSHHFVSKCGFYCKSNPSLISGSRPYNTMEHVACVFLIQLPPCKNVVTLGAEIFMVYLHVLNSPATSVVRLWGRLDIFLSSNVQTCHVTSWEFITFLCCCQCCVSTAYIGTPWAAVGWPGRYRAGMVYSIFSSPFLAVHYKDDFSDTKTDCETSPLLQFCDAKRYD